MASTCPGLAHDQFASTAATDAADASGSASAAQAGRVCGPNGAPAGVRRADGHDGRADGVHGGAYTDQRADPEAAAARDTRAVVSELAERGGRHRVLRRGKRA